MDNLTKSASKQSPSAFSKTFYEKMKEKLGGMIEQHKDQVNSDFAIPIHDPSDVAMEEEVEEDVCGWVEITEEEEEALDERRIVTKVSSTGKKIKKVKCGKGFKLKNGKCVPQSGGEKLARRKGTKAAIRKKKADVSGQKLAQKKTKKALKKRKAFGL